MKSDTFDPANPFGDVPPTGIGAEIEMLVAEFAKLGVSAHSAVPLWLGKPNRFTSILMHSAKEVLDYIAAELELSARNRAEAHGQAPAGDEAEAVVSTGEVTEVAERKRLHRERVVLANDAWRQAIRDRAAATLSWDQYVENLRKEYQKLKLIKP